MSQRTKQLAVQRRFQRRKQRVKMSIAGTTNRPRLSVYRSLNSIYAQIIDDANGVTLLAVSDVHLTAEQKKQSKSDRARFVGELLATKAKAAKITEVVFDRSGYAYHGRVKALADGARAGGLQF